MPTLAIIQGLERLCTSGPTVQARCFAGLFAAAVHNSCRGPDIQRTRHLSFTEGSVTGQSRFKGVPIWMRWAFRTEAFGDIPWVTPWAEALSASGLPGKDFLVMGVNATLTEWSTGAAL